MFKQINATFTTKEKEKLTFIEFGFFFFASGFDG